MGSRKQKKQQQKEYWKQYWMSGQEKLERDKTLNRDTLRRGNFSADEGGNTPEDSLDKADASENLYTSGNAFEHTKKADNKTESLEQKKLIDDLPDEQLTAQQKFWVYTKSILLASRPFLLYLLTPAIIMAIGKVLSSRYITYDAAYEQQVMNFYTFLGITAVLFFLYRSAKKKGRRLQDEITISFQQINWKYILAMLGFGYGLSLLISSVYTLLPDAWMENYDSYTLAAFQGYDVVLALTSTILLGPVAEEIIFRGYMLNRLLPRFGETKSIWIVTAVFALCHISPLWILYGIGFGWILAKIAIRHDNILYSLFLHIGFNLPTLFNYIIMKYESLSSVLYANDFLIVCYGIFGAAAAWFLWKYYKKAENL